MAEERIKSTMTFSDMLIVMSDGNPGAATVLKKMFPMDILLILRLDSKEVYGSKIWMLYKDCAKEDYSRFVDIIKNDLGTKSFNQVYKDITGADPRI